MARPNSQRRGTRWRRGRSSVCVAGRACLRLLSADQPRQHALALPWRRRLEIQGHAPGPAGHPRRCAAAAAAAASPAARLLVLDQLVVPAARYKAVAELAHRLVGAARGDRLPRLPRADDASLPPDLAVADLEIIVSGGGGGGGGAPPRVVERPLLPHLHV